MKCEDVLSKMFEAEFCDSKDKAEKERELQEILLQACEQTAKPLHVLKPAFLKVYPQYRAKRLSRELPDLPFEIRGN
jgi:16S rRNA U1498 N3-methylase RsmE